MIPEAFTAMIAGIRLWGDKKNETVQVLKNKSEAVELVMNAVIATKAYLYELKEGHEPSRSRERNLSQKWQQAAMAIRDYDYQLYESAQVKALGYADPVEWKRAELRPWAVKLDIIIDQCECLLSQSRNI